MSAWMPVPLACVCLCIRSIISQQKPGPRSPGHRASGSNLGIVASVVSSVAGTRRDDAPWDAIQHDTMHVKGGFDCLTDCLTN
ncbi:hypothetical protein LZ31DRAFT_322474 [Colletotrichum somersetense]|nr:hypothetical protein LZ31DRAFT_322474 [Colletotrichum somersetense]